MKKLKTLLLTEGMHGMISQVEGMARALNTEFDHKIVRLNFPWNLISYTWSWSPEVLQILSLIGAYSLSLISITLFCIPFLFFQKEIVLKNVLFILFFFIIFIFLLN